MTVGEVKKYLKQAVKMNKRLCREMEKVEQLRNSLQCKSPSLEGTGGTASENRVPDTIAEIIEREKRIEKLQAKYLEKYKEIEKVIRSLEDETYIDVMERRYLMFERFEGKYDKENDVYIKGISDKTGYSPSRVYQIHGRALQKIAVNYSELQLKNVL